MGVLKLTYPKNSFTLKVAHSKNWRKEKVVQRWFSVDPWEQKYPFISPYASMFNDPINLTDTRGLGNEGEVVTPSAAPNENTIDLPASSSTNTWKTEENIPKSPLPNTTKLTNSTKTCELNENGQLKRKSLIKTYYGHRFNNIESTEPSVQKVVQENTAKNRVKIKAGPTTTTTSTDDFYEVFKYLKKKHQEEIDAANQLLDITGFVADVAELQLRKAQAIKVLLEDKIIVDYKGKSKFWSKNFTHNQYVKKEFTTAAKAKFNARPVVKAFKAVNVVGHIVSAGGIVITLVEIADEGPSVSTTADLVFGVVGYCGPIGLTLSATYFIGKTLFEIAASETTAEPTVPTQVQNCHGDLLPANFNGGKK